MTFEDLGIHKKFSAKLLSSIKEGRVPHAQYIESKEASGALGFALSYAQALLEGEPDMFGGKDTRASRMEHPDLHLVFPMVQAVDKTCNTLIPELRAFYIADPLIAYEDWLEHLGEKNRKAIISKHEAEAINSKLSLRAFEGGRKILLIWMAEKMNTEASNKLLKLIEEPPESSVIILLGRNADELLPTIRSRVQLIQLPQVSAEELQNKFGTGTWTSLDELRKGAKEEESDEAERVIAWLRLCYQRKVQETMTWCDEQTAIGREHVIQVLGQAIGLCHEAFRKNCGLQVKSQEDEIDTFSTRFSPFVHPGNIELLNEALNKAIQDIQRNGNARIVLLDLSFLTMRWLRVPNPANAPNSQNS